MAQATVSSTDELLSQLAASEIDRLLSEADAKEMPPAPQEAPAPPPPVVVEKAAEPVTQGAERIALLDAAGFDSKEAAKEPTPPAAAEAPAAPAVQDERSALLQAAGFETPDGLDHPVSADAKLAKDDDRVPIYLKPLVWMNLPFENCPSMIKQMLGRAGVVTLVNALAVLTYVFFFKKH